MTHHFLPAGGRKGRPSGPTSRPLARPPGNTLTTTSSGGRSTISIAVVPARLSGALKAGVERIATGTVPILGVDRVGHAVRLDVNQDPSSGWKHGQPGFNLPSGIESKLQSGVGSQKVLKTPGPFPLVQKVASAAATVPLPSSTLLARPITRRRETRRTRRCMSVCFEATPDA